MNNYIIKKQNIIFLLVYSSNLEEIVSSRQNDNGADELLVQGGYATPLMVSRLRNLTDIKLTIIYGCQKEDQRRKQNHETFLTQDHSNVDVYFQHNYCHAKIYCWLRNSQVVDVLSGSANFSEKGLTNENSEILFEVNKDDYEKTYLFIKNNLENSTLCKDYIIDSDYKENIYLEDNGENNKKVNNFEVIQHNPPKIKLFLHNSKDSRYTRISGYGHTKSHTNENDGELSISKKLIDNLPKFFPNDGTNIMLGRGTGAYAKKKLPNAIFKFRDGKTLDMSFEGGVNGKFKNIRSFGDNSKLGLYLREKVGIKSGEEFTKEIFDKYGRDYLEITYLGEGLYEVDF